MPNFLHVVPVGDNAVLDGVFEGEDTTIRFGLGFFTKEDLVRIGLAYSNHGCKDNSGFTIQCGSGCPSFERNDRC